jgi:hypothetical protein
LLWTTENLARCSDSDIHRRTCIPRWQKHPSLNRETLRGISASRDCLVYPGRHSAILEERRALISALEDVLQHWTAALIRTAPERPVFRLRGRTKCPAYFALISASGIIALSLHTVGNFLFCELRLGTGCPTTQILGLQRAPMPSALVVVCHEPGHQEAHTTRFGVLHGYAPSLMQY